MVSTLETEKELKSKSEVKGSKEEPLPWTSPGGNEYQAYKEDGKWYIKTSHSEKFTKLEGGSYFSKELDTEFKEVDTSSPDTYNPDDEEFGKEDGEEEEFELAEKPKTEAETQKSLSDPQVQKQIIADYKFGKSTGAIAKSLGFEQNKANRNKIRNILKKAGVYKQKELEPKNSGPDAETIMHKEIKEVSGAMALAEKIGEQKGTNPGGLYKGTDGVKRYVKFYSDPLQASCEMLSNSVYNDLGIGAPVSMLVNDNGKTAFASEYIDGGTVLKNATLDKGIAQKIMKGFAADVLLKNWDAVGTGMDNIVIKGNEVYRIDNGGSLLFRAKAGKKSDSSLNDMSELSLFFDSAKNPYYSKIAKAAGYRDINSMGPELVSQIDNIEKMVKQYGGWDSYIDKVQPQLDVTTKMKVASMLKTRTEALKGVAKSLGQKKQEAAASKGKGEEVKLHTPTTYEPGKLAAIAGKYVSQMGKSYYSQSSAEEVYSKFYKDAGVSASSGQATYTAVHGWCGSSHGKGAILMKIVAAQFYGKDPTAEPKMDKGVKGHYGDYPSAVAKAKTMQEAFLAQKELTKEWVKAHGVKTVYRGIGGELAKKIKESIKNGDKTVEFNANSLSSWSESQAKAKSFSGGGIVMKMKVDPDHVWATYGSAPHFFSSFMSEKEYIMGAPGEKFTISVDDIEVQGNY